MYSLHPPVLDMPALQLPINLTEVVEDLHLPCLHEIDMPSWQYQVGIVYAILDSLHSRSVSLNLFIAPLPYSHSVVFFSL